MRGTSLFLWLTMAAIGFCSEEDERFLDGLRARRLFALAEQYCKERLERPDLKPRETAELNVELIRCYTGRALNVGPDERAQWWQAARQTAADYATAHGPAPSVFLVRVQEALTQLAEGQLQQQEAELTQAGPAAVEAALTVLRKAARQLEVLDQDLSRAVPDRHRRGDDGDLTADELISLQHHVRYHLARACRVRGSCYDAASDDRIALTTQAVEVIDQALRQVSDDDPLSGRLQLERAIALRLMDDLDRAAKTLTNLASASQQSGLAQKAAVEAARLDLARSEPLSALKRLDKTLADSRLRVADLDFAYLETLLALCQIASEQNDEAQADSWRKQAVAAVGVIDQNHGAYWARRADLALVNSLGSLSGVGDVDVLVRAGDDLYRKGQLDDAIATYTQAAEAADRVGDSDRTFLLHYKAAIVDQARQRYDAAGVGLRALASRSRTHPRAPQAHLLAAWNLAQQARQDPAALDAYAETLQEHVRLWPDDKTTDTARLWLGRYYQSRGQWQAASDAYGGIANDGEQADEAVQAAVICWARLLQQAADKGDAVDLLAATAGEFFERRIEGLLADPDAIWSPLDRQCALEAARIRLKYQADGHPQAELVLRAALKGSAAAPKDWQTEARALLVAALVGQPGKARQAEAELADIGAASPQQLLSILTAVNRLAASAGDRVRRDLATVRLGIVSRLQPAREQLAPSQQLLLDRTHAEALLDNGRRAEAMSRFEKLATAHPDNLGLQQAHAQLLLDSSDQASWEKALERWRRIASRCQPRTDAWYQARYSVALALFQLGRAGEAADRIRYLQVTPPGLDATPWKDRLLELLDRCEAGR